MKRKIAALAALVATSLLVVLAVWLSTGWDGVRDRRRLAPGDTLKLESGLTLKVPTGWQGSQTLYYHVPLWLPFGQARRDRFHISEQVALSAASSQGDPDDFVAMTFYDDSAAPSGGMLLADSATVRLYAGGRDEPTRLETAVPGAARGHVFVRPASVEGSSARPRLVEVWDLLEIQGAELP